MAELVLPKIDAYAAAHSLPESPVRRALREETERTMEFHRMLVGPLEGAFLHVMTRLTRATRVLEIGMFTGYSALCFAEALPANGRVLTCEVDEEAAALNDGRWTVNVVTDDYPLGEIRGRLVPRK